MHPTHRLATQGQTLQSVRLFLDEQFYARATACRDPSLALQIRVSALDASAETAITDTDSVFIIEHL